MKWPLLILLIIFATSVTADKGLIEVYKPNELFDLGIHLTNTSGEVEGANCDIQIRNETYNVILNDDMNEIGGGWYNYTYNTTEVGKFFCRQNCTYRTSFAAETCDFIIGVDDDMILGMLPLIPLIIAFFLLVVSLMLDSKKYWAMQIGFVGLAFVFIFQSYQYSTLVIIEFFNSPNIINALGDSTWIYGMSFVAMVFIFLITFIYHLFMLFSGKKHKTGEY